MYFLTEISYMKGKSLILQTNSIFEYNNNNNNNNNNTIKNCKYHYRFRDR